jgi:hypothetical protein
MIPDRLPETLRQVIASFPPGSLQFEVGIQTFNEEVGARIKRRQDAARLEDNLRFLRSQTGVHIHADLIAGLPGETLESFAVGFDRLIALGPQEIQVGTLKRLRGTPIVRHDEEWQMCYNPEPPYEILQNNMLDFTTMQKLRRFSKYWDHIANSGNFIETTPLLWAECPSPKPDSATPSSASSFWQFLACSEWLFARTGRTDSIALARLMQLLFEYLTTEKEIDVKRVAGALSRDYQRGGRRDKPSFLKDILDSDAAPLDGARHSGIPRRQARHLASVARS